jgi:RNA recognition motif-containing protein
VVLAAGAAPIALPARVAIAAMNGKALDGRELRVNKARPRTERGGLRGGSDSSVRGSRKRDARAVAPGRAAAASRVGV